MNQLLVKVVILGEPKSQPRPRFVGGRVISNIKPAVSMWQGAVRRAASEALCSLTGGLPLTNALRVDVTFWFGTKKPERWGKPHTQKPDRDNCDKLILDECTKVGLFNGDDCRVSAGTIKKRWCAPQGAGALIEVYADTGVCAKLGLATVESTATPEWLA
jgi:Holliday junction resolvase RusA-like endonuclease